MMADLVIGNVDEDTSEEEVREFLMKYGFPSFDKMQPVPGTGSRPGLLLTFNDLDEVALRALQPRIQNMFWKNRTINVSVMREYGY
ncbi:MAG TPA: RNA-binding protein [Paraburkholderia sp.]|jgi:RNA recognition motif-containing protein|nr:RNA-binding protein [Paraburkholderia sp.]